MNGHKSRGIASGTVLVTGAAGFIGSTVVDELLRRGYRVVGVDNFLGNYAREMKEANIAAAWQNAAFTFHELDLARDDLGDVVAGADAIFHFAARPGVRDSWGQHYEEYLTHNVLATQRLLEAARARPDAPFILASSSSVYGDAPQLPVTERTVPAPVSPYGASKLAAEDLAHLYAHSYGLNVTILRFFTVFGPRQRPDMAIHKFVRAILDGDPVILYGEGERRDFTFVGDVARACADVLARGAFGRTFNVASGRTVAVEEVLAEIEKALGKKAVVRRAPHQRGDVRVTHGDITALKEAIGYEPKTPLAEGIAAQVAWMTEAVTARDFRVGSGRRGPKTYRPLLSVIIVNYNAGHVIEKCISSCWEHAPAEGEMEIIVVDNASADGSAEMLAARDDVVVVRNRRNEGYAAANNQGIAKARGDYICLLNPDVVVTPGLFEGMINFLGETPDAGIVGPALLSPNGRIQESYRRFPNLFNLIGNRRSLLYRWWPRNPFSRRGFYLDLDLGGPVRVDFIAGAVMTFRRTLVDLIGPMDPKYFMYVEDADFCRRARDAGFYTYLLPQLSALHYWGESSSRHPYRIAFIHHISMMRYFRRHEPLQFILYLLLLPFVGVHIIFELLYARRAKTRKGTPRPA